MSHECPGWECPYLADARRDAEALVGCAVRGDTEGTRVICDALADDACLGADVSWLLAEICARMLRDMARDMAAPPVPEEDQGRYPGQG